MQFLQQTIWLFIAGEAQMKVILINDAKFHQVSQ